MHTNSSLCPQLGSFKQNFKKIIGPMIEFRILWTWNMLYLGPLTFFKPKSCNLLPRHNSCSYHQLSKRTPPINHNMSRFNPLYWFTLTWASHLKEKKNQIINRQVNKLIIGLVESLSSEKVCAARTPLVATSRTHLIRFGLWRFSMLKIMMLQRDDRKMGRGGRANTWLSS